MRDKDQLDSMLGAARFRKYFVIAGEDVEKAVCLYRWNTHLAGALFAQLSYFEVLTRNAMNRVMQEWYYEQCGQRDWALEHQSATRIYEMLNRPMRQARSRAREEASHRRFDHARKNAPLNHDDVVAQLTLGNWSNLLGEALPDHKLNAQILWQECMHKAFPNVDSSDQSRETIGKKFERLTRLRNRVSHQENLLETNVRARLNDMLTVLGSIDASYPRWVMVDSHLRQVVREDPRHRGR